MASPSSAAPRSTSDRSTHAIGSAEVRRAFLLVCDAHRALEGAASIQNDGYKAMAGPQYVFVMTGLSKTYPGGRQVLKDIWLSFYPGAKIGIVGVNGSGKSTLMRIMAGQDKEF